MNDAEIDAVDTLREVIDRRKLKLKAIAEEAGVPYRSLQNYLSKTSRIPLATYLDLCRVIGIPPDYPVARRFKLDHHALQQALIDVMGSALNTIDVDEDSNLRVRSPAGEPDEKDVRRVAGFLAAMINGRYDLIREAELWSDDEAAAEEPSKRRG